MGSETQMMALDPPDIENTEHHDPEDGDHADEMGEFDVATTSFIDGQYESDSSNGESRTEDKSDAVDSSQPASCEKESEPDLSAEKDSFMSKWLPFITERGTAIEPFVVSGREIEIFDLYRHVCSLGGLDTVIAAKQMARVAVDLGYKRSPDLR
jgi:hypothetical protein